MTYCAEEVYFSYKSEVLGPQGTPLVMIPTGEHCFSFAFQLPVALLPADYDGYLFGKVEYLIEAKIKRPEVYTVDYRAHEYIHLIPCVDLNKDPSLSEPQDFTTSKKFGCGCFESLPLELTVRLPKTGYCLGEILKFEVEINNSSNKTVTELSAKFVQVNFHPL